MYADPRDQSSTASARNEQIAALHREHARQLERRVAHRARAPQETIEDACSVAWLQLLTHTSIDLNAPSWRALGWLTQTATRDWRLEDRRRRDGLLDHVALERDLRLGERAALGADEIFAQHERLALVAQIPERPRRFLLRLVLGYGYREIAAVGESVSLTATNHQFARARRLLRAVEAAEAQPEPDTPRSPASLNA